MFVSARPRTCSGASAENVRFSPLEPLSVLQKERQMSEVEVLARVERRRKWTQEEKAALLAEVDAAGDKVRSVARRHGIAESVLYNWRSARKAALQAGAGCSGTIRFLPVGVIGEAANETPAMRASLASPDRSVERRAGAMLRIVCNRLFRASHGTQRNR